MNNKSRNIILINLKAIFNELFHVNLDELKFDYLNEELLGNKFKCAPRDLLYLYFKIEKTFNIKIPKDDIIKGKFNNINNIINIILIQQNFNN